MFLLKNIIGIIAVVLTFAGYLPYFRDILKGKTVPHLYSWFVWGIVTAIIFALQVSDKAGAGSFVTFAAGSMCVVVFILGLRQKGKKDITKVDKIFLLLAFVALAIWLFAKQPVISILLAISIDLLGFAPTVRKSWNNPHSETLSFYIANTFRFILAIIALQRYTIITALFPVAWALADGLFALMLMVRRRQLK